MGREEELINFKKRLKSFILKSGVIGNYDFEELK